MILSLKFLLLANLGLVCTGTLLPLPKLKVMQSALSVLVFDCLLVTSDKVSK